MQALGLERDLVDASVYDNTVARFREARIALPTFSQLADPSRIPAKVREALAGVGPDDAHPLNLFRVNWYNDDSRRGFASVPAHVVLPKSLTGVDARIVVVFGNRFPMIGHHGPVRPNAPPRDLAVHRQLLQGWGGDIPDHELPWRGRAA
jgi:cysteine synthase A